MKRYCYSFYYAEGPLKGDLITTISFIMRDFCDAEFMAQCYCYCLAASNVPYCRVYYKLLKSGSYGK